MCQKSMQFATQIPTSEHGATHSTDKSGSSLQSATDPNIEEPWCSTNTHTHPQAMDSQKGLAYFYDPTTSCLSVPPRPYRSE